MDDTPKVTSEPTGSDSKGAVESQVQRIPEIKGDEVLGSGHAAREEHSGQNSPDESDDMTDSMADNRPDQVQGEKTKR